MENVLFSDSQKLFNYYFMETENHVANTMYIFYKIFFVPCEYYIEKIIVHHIHTVDKFIYSNGSSFLLRYNFVHFPTSSRAVNIKSYENYFSINVEWI